MPRKKKKNKNLKKMVEQIKAQEQPVMQEKSDLDPPQQEQELQVPAMLKKVKDVDIIITNTEPEALIFITPTLRKLKTDFDSKIVLHCTAPQNPSFLDLIRGLDTVKDIQVHQEINDDLVKKLEKNGSVVLMLNFLAAMKEGMPKGLHCPQALGAMVQIVLNQFECLEFEVSLPESAKKAASVVYGEDYFLICPEFMAGIDTQYTAQRCWDRNKWLEVIDVMNEKYDKEIIVLSFENGIEPILPPGIYDSCTSIVSKHTDEVTAIISNASIVLGVDAGFVQIARALNKSIIELHSGGPVSWSAAIYPMDERNGSTRVLATIDINNLSIEDVLNAVEELESGESVIEDNEQETTKIRDGAEANANSEGTEDNCTIGDNPGG